MLFILLQLSVVLPIGLCTLTGVEQKLVYAHVVERRCVLRGTESANQSAASVPSGKDVFCWM